jgi:hypothetical protein
MDVNLRIENPSIDRQGHRSTFHLIQPKITRCLPLYLAYWLQNAIESPDVCRRWMLVILRILFTVQTPVVASWGQDPQKPVIHPLCDGDYFNIEKTECNFYS